MALHLDLVVLLALCENLTLTLDPSTLFFSKIKAAIFLIFFGMIRLKGDNSHHVPSRKMHI